MSSNLIVTTYPSHRQALIALAMEEYNAGHCEQCGLWTRLKVCEAAPEGDADRWCIGTECCGDGLVEDK